MIKKKVKEKILKKPTAKLKGIDSKKFISQGLSNQPLVKQGKTGYMDKEMMEEAKWLS